ncbi:hypothetical protein D3C76_1495630 [compost metagenome]
MHVERSFISLEIVTPNFLNELLSGEGSPRMAAQLEQQLELLERQREAVFAAVCLERFAVHPQRPDRHGLRDRHLVALEQRLHPSDELRGFERFDEIIVRTQLEPLHDLPGFPFGGQHEKRHVIIPAQLAA